jgi:hypothetical protein
MAVTTPESAFSTTASAISNLSTTTIAGTIGTIGETGTTGAIETIGAIVMEIGTITDGMDAVGMSVTNMAGAMMTAVATAEIEETEETVEAVATVGMMTTRA